jgi:valyl-tRNA synthetase
MMDKTFDPAAVEARIAARWEAAQAFRAGRPERRGAEAYTIVIPPPNVTGSLHMGHALNNTLQDILCRFERMRGKDVLWQPGTDHAGIATQMVVERRLAAENKTDRRSMGREAFLREVWKQKEESEGTILGQLKRLGASCDWSRTRFTMDEGLSRAVMKVFVTLHREGYIYKDKRLVNWDPKLLTAISDLEVQQVEVKGHLWHIRYPIEGESDLSITVATTRPETMLGDVAVAVHPDDDRYADLVGRHAILPLVGRRIPIVADEYSDPEKGTGAVKITPAHDFNDFEVGRRHGLAPVNILGPEARLDLQGDPDFLRDLEPSPDLDAVLALDGEDRAAARKAIVAMLEERGFLETVEPHTHMVPHGDRSGVVIEPYLTDQWYVNVKPLAERALDAVGTGRTRFVPETWEKTYRQWLDNIEPWCVSRQLWWGHQIPAWYAPDGSVYVAENEEEALAQALVQAVVKGEMSEDEATALANDAERAAAYLARDEDVLDTWFSSALWPFSTLGWPDATPELARYYPTSALVTGFDIIFFWVARMMMMGLHFMKEVPFRDVYIHALVRDERGAKMSKSKGNIIDPLEIIDQYGADALRFTLAAMAAQGRDLKLSAQRVEGNRNFATKIWNAARFAEMNGCEPVLGFDPRAVRETLNRWVLGEAERAVADVTRGIAEYKFNEAAGAAYRFVWGVFCDWHVELTKPVLQGEDSPAKDETRATTAYVLDVICKLLHPFMPFLTEELWAARGDGVNVGQVGADTPLSNSPPTQVGPARLAQDDADLGQARDQWGRGQVGALLALASWPALEGLADKEAEAEIGWVVDLVSEIRSARSETNVAAGAQIPLVLVSPSAQARARLAIWDETIRRLARLSDISLAERPPPKSVQLIVRGEVAALPLEGIVDLAAEQGRLQKELSRLDAEIAKIEAKLGNADFLRRAPEEVVDEQRERKEEAEEKRRKIGEALSRLKAAA